jgi:hypothetical protein
MLTHLAAERPNVVLATYYVGVAGKLECQWSTAQQVERELSLWPEFGLIPGNLSTFQRDNL